MLYFLELEERFRCDLNLNNTDSVSTSESVEAVSANDPESILDVPWKYYAVDQIAPANYHQLNSLDYFPPCSRPIRKIKILFLSETSKNEEILVGLKK